MNEFLMNTYARLPLAFVRGEGAWLWDEQERRYLDAISGLGVCSLGHSHPELTAVISEQAGTLMHTANLARIPWQEALAERLASVSGIPRSFIANSGAEAVECALKLARLHGHQREFSRPQVVVAEKSFHGRTMAALSATDSRKVQAGFEPLVSGFLRVPFGDIDALTRLAGNANEVTAVMLEPIQGEAGVCVPPAGYLQAVRALCDQQGWLLILDEIQSGLCRTGAWYAHQLDDITADIITTAKALANGIPIAACLATEAVADLFSPGRHGSTFGGNPLACRTACAVLDIMRRDDIASQAAATGEAMLAAFRQRLAQHPAVVDIRGRGLMIGIELDRPAGAIKSYALDNGLLINVTRESVIRLLPPLIIDSDQAERIVATVCEALKEQIT